ncbi:MAG: hypothetical protein EPN21_13165 [Methylococcaceae bacterium]|nr:MAG: hypothetical protein EPN21_13165 [Methylococcaceae bacterium]
MTRAVLVVEFGAITAATDATGAVSTAATIPVEITPANPAADEALNLSVVSHTDYALYSPYENGVVAKRTTPATPITETVSLLPSGQIDTTYAVDSFTRVITVSALVNTVQSVAYVQGSGRVPSTIPAGSNLTSDVSVIAGQMQYPIGWNGTVSVTYTPPPTQSWRHSAIGQPGQAQLFLYSTATGAVQTVGLTVGAAGGNTGGGAGAAGTTSAAPLTVAFSPEQPTYYEPFYITAYSTAPLAVYSAYSVTGKTAVSHPPVTEIVSLSGGLTANTDYPIASIHDAVAATLLVDVATLQRAAGSGLAPSITPVGGSIMPQLSVQDGQLQLAALLAGDILLTYTPVQGQRWSVPPVGVPGTAAFFITSVPPGAVSQLVTVNLASGGSGSAGVSPAQPAKDAVPLIKAEVDPSSPSAQDPVEVRVYSTSTCGIYSPYGAPAGPVPGMASLISEQVALGTDGYPATQYPVQAFSRATASTDLINLAQAQSYAAGLGSPPSTIRAGSDVTHLADAHNGWFKFDPAWSGAITLDYQAPAPQVWTLPALGQAGALTLFVYDTPDRKTVETVSVSLSAPAAVDTRLPAYAVVIAPQTSAIINSYSSTGSFPPAQASSSGPNGTVTVGEYFQVYLYSVADFELYSPTASLQPATAGAPQTITQVCTVNGGQIEGLWYTAGHIVSAYVSTVLVNETAARVFARGLGPAPTLLPSGYDVTALASAVNGHALFDPQWSGAITLTYIAPAPKIWWHDPIPYLGTAPLYLWSLPDRQVTGRVEVSTELPKPNPPGGIYPPPQPPYPGGPGTPVYVITTVTILDDYTGVPIKDADVFIDGLSVGLTDNTGQVNAGLLTKGTHNIAVKKPGYTDSDADGITANDTIEV